MRTIPRCGLLALILDEYDRNYDKFSMMETTGQYGRCMQRPYSTTVPPEPTILVVNRCLNS
ncbi:MAG: hypothetical protein F6K22_10195 [Okeania sp. SIO2F4]|uniref:hypothetical protein n=1 Tax=Okeania sp. SIO2F4 TaxID=2607790 RepID=UPI00142C6E20|nr:hypothetical protein [Okeania sp. SIO2F4]NES03188.1 hypothetical protein [Okeania sp. SIO2F4]